MSGFAGMLRLAWRRNWVFYTCWVIGLAVLMPATVTKYHDLVPDGIDGQVMLAPLGGNPTMRAILGPPFDLGDAWRVHVLARRHVRRRGRRDDGRPRRHPRDPRRGGRGPPSSSYGLARSPRRTARSGRRAVARRMLRDGVSSRCSWSRADPRGRASASAGDRADRHDVHRCRRGSRAGVPERRTARVWSLGVVLRGLYLLRAIVDGSGSNSTLDAIRWAMPLDWAVAGPQYAYERWWCFLLPLAVTVVLVLLAFRLEAVRDHGAGLRAGSRAPARPPRTCPVRSGSPGACSPVASSAGPSGSSCRRWHRVAVDSRSIDLRGQDQIIDMLRKMGGGADAMRDAFFIAMLGIMATIVTLAGVMVCRGCAPRRVRAGPRSC